MRQSGARLVEVGTTNRTRRADYASARSSPDTGLLVKVHRSNFALVGFTEEVAARGAGRRWAARAACRCSRTWARARSCRCTGEGLTPEPTVRQAVGRRRGRGGLLRRQAARRPAGGHHRGPQGRCSQRIKTHPLTRALRVDKMTVAALEATLELYRDGRPEAVPTHSLLAQQPEVLRARAERLSRPARGAAASQRRVVAVDGTGGRGGHAAGPVAFLRLQPHRRGAGSIPGTPARRRSCRLLAGSRMARCSSTSGVSRRRSSGRSRDAVAAARSGSQP